MDVARAWYGLAWLMLVGLFCSSLLPAQRPVGRLLSDASVAERQGLIWLGVRSGQQPIKVTWLALEKAQAAGVLPGELLVCQHDQCCWQGQSLPLRWRLALQLPISIDTILPEEWQILPGIGPKRAAALAIYQRQLSQQRALVQQVPGIGPRLLARLQNSHGLIRTIDPKRTPETCIPSRDLP